MTTRWTASKNPFIALDLRADTSARTLASALARWEATDPPSDAASRAGAEDLRRHIRELGEFTGPTGEPRHWRNWRKDAHDRFAALAVCARVLCTHRWPRRGRIRRSGFTAIREVLGLTGADVQCELELQRAGVQASGTDETASERMRARLARPTESENPYQVDQLDRGLLDLRDLLCKKGTLGHVVTAYPELQNLLLGDGQRRLEAFQHQPNLYHFLALSLDPEIAGENLVERPTAELRALAEQVIAPQGGRTRTLHLVAQDTQKWFHDDEARRRYDWIWLVESKCGPALGLLWPALQLAIHRGRVSPAAWSCLQTAAAELAAKGDEDCLLYRRHDWGHGAELRRLLELSPDRLGARAPLREVARSERPTTLPAVSDPSPSILERGLQRARRFGAELRKNPLTVPFALVLTFLLGAGEAWLTGLGVTQVLWLRDRATALLDTALRLASEWLSGGAPG